MELSDRSLEAELAAIAEHAEPGRTARLAVRHWGWDGRGGATLETTGKEGGGITRERVRQLCERLAHRLGAGADAPALDRALVLAAHAAPTTAHELARRLADERIAAQPFEPAGLLGAAAVLGRAPTFTIATVRGVRFVLPDPPDPGSDVVAVVTSIVDTAKALVRRGGAARVRDVTGAVAADLAVWVDDDLVTAVVSEPDDFIWLERRTGWFHLPTVAKNAVISRLFKIISLTGAVGLADLHAGIRRDERMREFVMPEYILAELCARVPGVRVDGDVVRATRRLEAADLLEATELLLFRVLSGWDGPADRHELEQACERAGMKPSSFNNRIAYSSIIREAGHGRYGLRGLAPSKDEAGVGGHESGALPAAALPSLDVPRPGDIEQFRPSRRR